MPNIPAPDISSTPRPEAPSTQPKQKETFWKKLTQRFRKKQENRAVSQIIDNQVQKQNPHKILEQIASEPMPKKIYKIKELAPILFAPEKGKLLPPMEISPLAITRKREMNPNESQY